MAGLWFYLALGCALLSLVFSVIFCRLVFKARNISFRLVGASVMVAGVFLLYN